MKNYGNKKSNKKITEKITRAAIIAAFYAGLTLAVYPISFGAWQIRISEALTVLPFYFPEAIPGLFVGCLLSNLITMNVFDIIFGSLATLLAAYLSFLCSKLGKKGKLLSLVPPVLINAIVVSAVLTFSMTGDRSFGITFLINFATVFVGQAISCFGLGFALSFLIEKVKDKIIK